MNAPLCVWSQYYNFHDPETSLAEFKKDGIEHVELSYEHSSALLARSENHVETGRKFAEYLKEIGISITQGHLAFPTAFCTDENFMTRLVREIEMFCAIGIKNAVLHCDYMKDVDISYDDRREVNIVKLRELVNRISDCDITLCLENLRPHTMGIDEILYIIEKVGSDKLGICLDTGHLNVSKADSQRDFILKAGEHLKALHLHDNDGKSDLHVLPYGRGEVDFFEIVHALREIDYNGEFNFEIPGESVRQHLPILHAKIEYLKKLYNYII